MRGVGKCLQVKNVVANGYTASSIGWVLSRVEGSVWQVLDRERVVCWVVDVTLHCCECMGLRWPAKVIEMLLSETQIMRRVDKPLLAKCSFAKNLQLSCATTCAVETVSS